MKDVKWYHLNIRETAEKLKTCTEKGLDAEEVKKRKQKYGLNELKEKKPVTLFQRFINQFKDFLVMILIIASIISLVLGEVTDSVVILIIVILNAILGVLQEYRASKALEALKQLASPKTLVVREGKIQEIPSKELVPGDIVLLEAGNYVPADLRLIESVNLKIDEASLTGESVPVEKDAGAVFAEDVPLGERFNSAFMGTIITYGRGKGIVTATGMDTQIGLIAQMLESLEEEETPLQKKLSQFGKVLGTICLVIVAIIFAIGVLRGLGYREMFMTAISLAVAAIPEGLPAIVTIVLAIGMQRMVKRHSIVKKLHAVETLGSTTVICTDKTGTLTQNEMTVTVIYTGGQIYKVTGEGYKPYGEFINEHKGATISPNSVLDLAQILKIAALCNDSRIEESKENNTWKVIGDPTEGALIVAAAKGGLWYTELNNELPRKQEIPFDSDRKRMTTIHYDKNTSKYLVCVKGAPDILLNLCNSIFDNGNIAQLTDDKKANILQINTSMANKALRVLGFAYRELESLPEIISPDVIETDLVFVGLMGMIDPPRKEAIEAVKVCKSAGIKPIMITGDYKDTAVAIAKELKLSDRIIAITGKELDEMSDEELEEVIDKVNVFARVSPEHKVKIVNSVKKKGEIVAMTGDGVNDAPALKNADIGIAMGITGTDVAKEASDLILTDDNFASIVAAVEEGRVIYSNIRKFINFLLSCNIAEILIIFFAMILGLPIPLIPIQILWLNLVTDAFPALALGVEKKEPGIMNMPPRDPKEPILNKTMRRGILSQSTAIAIAVLGIFFYALNSTENLVLARTFAFATLITSELFRAQTARSENIPLFKLGLFTNKYMFWGTLLSFVMMLIVMYIPFISNVFKTVPLTLNQWLIIVGFSLLPAIVAEITKALKL
ncbi:MAG: P-type Ca2+ transporter type [Thermosediminibacterales bacterium]|nr:P-type Ca2+ transporter type [Thermosediminibacterales bacterium]NPV42479.1 calcium-transporting P-type ATPase, PMR1-type [Bacillota bacterium]